MRRAALSGRSRADRHKGWARYRRAGPPASDNLDASGRFNQRSICADRIRDRLKPLSARLGSADWLDGAFSAGDLMIASVLLRLRMSGILDESPNLAAYLARGEARPAYQRAFAAQRAVNTSNAPH